MNLSEMNPFFEYIKNKKMMSVNSVAAWTAAVAAITPVLEADEATTDFVIANRDLIKNRLQNQNTKLTGSTLGEYLNRACRAIESFQEWKADRQAWEKNIAAKMKTRPAENSKKAVKEENGSSFDSNSKVLPIPIGNGKSFEVKLPEGYVMDDLVRVAWALAVYASDFDPAAVLSRFGKPSKNFRASDTRDVGTELTIQQ